MIKSTYITIKPSQIRKGTFLAVALLLASTRLAHAQDLVITDNGAGSTNQVTAASTQTSTVSQNNTAAINNNIQTSSDTGDNKASGNTGGDTIIKTGDANASVNIANAANSNTNTQGCCSTPSQTGSSVIAGNGAGSDNAVNVNSTNTSTIQSNNTATITNHITGTLNTGGNVGSHNTNGDVTIKTGNISAEQNIVNGPININNSSTANISNNDVTYSLSINGNGAGSDNEINVHKNNNKNIEENNSANILNNTVWMLDTGHNKANGNTNGDVAIITGSISMATNIINGPINVNSVTTNCGCTPVEHQQPTGGVTPSTPPPATTTVESTPSESNASSGAPTEQVAAAVASILPVTGSYSFLLMLIGNIALFFLGVILRLRSGRSPDTLSTVVA